jgi:hypothetical protein
MSIVYEHVLWLYKGETLINYLSIYLSVMQTVIRSQLGPGHAGSEGRSQQVPGLRADHNWYRVWGPITTGFRVWGPIIMKRYADFQFVIECNNLAWWWLLLLYKGTAFGTCFRQVLTPSFTERVAEPLYIKADTVGRCITNGNLFNLLKSYTYFHGPADYLEVDWWILQCT